MKQVIMHHFLPRYQLALNDVHGVIFLKMLLYIILYVYYWS
jgi:hypothetical protein